MDLELLLSNYGIDYEKGLRNCMGNPDFYKKILRMFLEDSCFKRAQAALKNESYKDLFGCMHELKGVSGNAALLGLFNATVPLVELLRNGTDDSISVKRIFRSVEIAYGLALDGIQIILSET